MDRPVFSKCFTLRQTVQTCHLRAVGDLFWEPICSTLCAEAVSYHVKGEAVLPLRGEHETFRVSILATFRLNAIRALDDLR